jgi:outer membrane lipoprotein-sorting protein
MASLLSGIHDILYNLSARGATGFRMPRRSGIRGEESLGMKYSSKLSAALILVVFLVLSFSVLVGAEDLPKPVQIKVNPLLDSEQETETFDEKYKQAMSEISISEEAAAVVDSIKAVVEGIEDLSLDISITEMRERRNEEVCLQLKLSVEHRLARIEFKAPSAVRGMIMVADQEKMEVRTFQPVTNIILVRGLDDASKEALASLSLGQDLTQFSSYLDFSQYNVEILEKSELEGVTDFLLEVDAPGEEVWYVRVKDDSWFPHEISVYKEDVLQGTMSLSNVVTNPGLSVEDLANLPDAKVERM